MSKNNAKPKPRQKSKFPAVATEGTVVSETAVEPISSIITTTTNIKPDSEMISIDLKKHRLKKSVQYNDISSVAKKLKDRLSKAAKRLSDPAISLPPTPPPSCSDKSESDMPQQKAQEEAANTMLSESDWSNSKPISLHNLQLLKQYLIFVSKESTDISFKDHSIQFSPLNVNESIDPSTESERSARCGATLIESYVHEASNMDKELHLSRPEDGRSYSRSRIDRKRPGRPPKSQLNGEVAADDKSESNQRIRMKRKSIQRHSSTTNTTNNTAHSTHQHLKKKNIQCICSSPHEEIESMVQCDDCYRYLHLECLELNDAALTETFRCPSCFLSLGSCTGKNAKLLSAITWRYAAQWKSQRLALKSQDAANTDDEDAEEYDDDDFSSAMDIDSSPLSKFNFTASNTFNHETSATASTTTPPPLHLHDDDDGYSTDLPGPETPTDWPDVSSESRFSSQESSASEVTTPNENLFLDPFDTKEDGQLVLDPESLEILSRLAYLQSLDSVKKELFAPNASDVFLCENLSNNSTVPVASPQAPRFAANVPPSDICSQDLSEFSFDSGPFWEPLF